MVWENQVNGDPLSWLLEDSDPGVRYLALRDLTGYSQDDPVLQKAAEIAHRDGPIAAVLMEMNEAGYWVKPGSGYNPKYRSIVWALILLGQLGASIRYAPQIETACRYLLENALTDYGQFSTSGAGSPSGTIDCLQGNLLTALMSVGYEDPRLDTAYEWMARSLTGEGIAAQGDKENPIRYYAYKSGPDFACGVNNNRMCAWGGIKVMLAFSYLPVGKRTALIEKAIDRGVANLFSVDPQTAAYPTRDDKPPSRSWRQFGFPVFYVTDMLQNLESLVRLGYGDDPRLVNALAYTLDKQDERGRWPLEYTYQGKTWVDFGAKRMPNKWVTYRALRVLKAAGPQE